MFKEIPIDNISISKRTLAYGVGFNDSDYKTTYTIDRKKYKCPFYRKWENMLARCYSESCHIKQPTYIGCTVSHEWLTFSNFKKWMEVQEWEGRSLDKDILIEGNKLYSEETCIFVTQEINTFLNEKPKTRSKYPIGVSFNGNKFIASCKASGKNKYLGGFESLEFATRAYIEFKASHIRNLADNQAPVLRDALYRRASRIEARAGKSEF